MTQFGGFEPFHTDTGNEDIGPRQRFLFAFDKGYDASVVNITQKDLDEYPDVYEPSEIGTWELCIQKDGLPLDALRLLRVPGAENPLGDPDGKAGRGMYPHLSDDGVTAILARLEATVGRAEAA